MNIKVLITILNNAQLFQGHLSSPVTCLLLFIELNMGFD